MTEAPKFEICKTIEDWEALKTIVQAQMANSFMKNQTLDVLPNNPNSIWVWKEITEEAKDINTQLRNI